MTKRKIHICYHSRADVAALAKTTSESFLVWECLQTLGELSEFNKVILVWILGHREIPGNEKAARLTKEGAIRVPLSQTAVIHLSTDKKIIKRHLELEQQASPRHW